MFQFLLLFFLLPSVIAQEYDIAPVGWAPAWVNETFNEVIGLFECILRCKVKEKCVGGSYELKFYRCRLTIRSDHRLVMIYRKKTSATIQAFGMHCNVASGYHIIPGYAIKQFNIEIYYNVSLATCTALCTVRFWCRSLDYNSKTPVCHLQPFGNKTDSLIANGQYVLKVKNC